MEIRKYVMSNKYEKELDDYMTSRISLFYYHSCESFMKFRYSKNGNRKKGYMG